MPRMIRRAVAACAAALLLASLAAGQGDERTITMNFKDADLEAVVQFMSELTSKNFILDSGLKKGKVTVISPTKITPGEAYEVFQAILQVNQFTIVPVADNIFKILATKDAKMSNIETVQGGEPGGDRIVTRIVPLAHVDAKEVADNVLNNLVDRNRGLIIPYPATNSLIMIDTYSNIERLLEIVVSLDVETVDTVFEIIQLQYASADALAKSLAQVVTEKGRSATRRRAPARGAQGAVQAVQAEVVETKIIPDSRTNSIIIITDPATLTELKALIRQLDVEIPKGSGKINVYYLKYADAENVASVLTAISKEAGVRPQPGQPQVTKAKATEIPVEFEEPVQVTADKTTNSLVIIASPQDYEILKGVIEKLDVRRPQVLVETLIVEMSFDKSLELGVEWRTTNDPTSDGFNVVGGTNFGELNSFAQNPLSAGSGMFAAIIDGTIEFGGVEFLNVGAFLRALQTRDDVNVLSTPHLLTTDNEEAEIIVSDNIPFQTSQKFDSNGNPIFTFEYRDVGLTLRYTPQINEDEYVRLKLFQEISKILSLSTGTTSNAPSTSRRSTKTTVVAKSGTTIVISGLVQDDTTINVSSVPCLGDLPVLGYLFRVGQNSKDKKNLLIFLTPYIIKTSSDIEEITQDKRLKFEQEALVPEERLDKAPEKLKRYLGPPDKLEQYLGPVPQEEPKQ